MCDDCEGTCLRNESDQASYSAESLLFTFRGLLRERRPQALSTRDTRASSSIAMAKDGSKHGDETKLPTGSVQFSARPYFTNRMAASRKTHRKGIYRRVSKLKNATRPYQLLGSGEGHLGLCWTMSNHG